MTGIFSILALVGYRLINAAMVAFALWVLAVGWVLNAAVVVLTGALFVLALLVILPTVPLVLLANWAANAMPNHRREG